MELQEGKSIQRVKQVAQRGSAATERRSLCVLRGLPALTQRTRRISVVSVFNLFGHGGHREMFVKKTRIYDLVMQSWFNTAALIFGDGKAADLHTKSVLPAS